MLHFMKKNYQNEAAILRHVTSVAVLGRSKGMSINCAFRKNESEMGNEKENTACMFDKTEKKQKDL